VPSCWHWPAACTGSFVILNMAFTAARTAYLAAATRSPVCHAASKPLAARSGVAWPFSVLSVVVGPVAVVVDDLFTPGAELVVAGVVVVGPALGPEEGLVEVDPVGSTLEATDVDVLVFVVVDEAESASVFLSLHAEAPSSKATATSTAKRDWCMARLYARARDELDARTARDGPLLRRARERGRAPWRTSSRGQLRFAATKSQLRRLSRNVLMYSGRALR
jgi:hypothetical protein